MKLLDSEKRLLVAVCLLIGLYVLSSFFGVGRTQYTGFLSVDTGSVSFTVEGTEPSPTVVTNVSVPGGGTRGALPGEIGFVVSISIGNSKRAIQYTAESFSERDTQITVKNIGDLTDIYKIYTNMIGASLNLKEFTLNPDNERTATVSIKVQDPGVMTGILFVEGSSGIKQIPIVITVVSSDQNIDVFAEIPDELKNVYAGNNLFVSVTLGGVDGELVDVVYVIKDASNNEVLRDQDVIALSGTTTFDKTLNVPLSLKPGTYVLGVEASYKGKTNVYATTFNVLSGSSIIPSLEEPSGGASSEIYTLVVLVMFLMFLIHVKHRKKKH